MCCCPDHPRACGANGVEWNDTTSGGGSSPRVRGKPRQSCRTPNHLRIIPARAGQTLIGLRACGPAADHPRACGANSKPSSDELTITGSSPRVRGKHRGRRETCPDHRIIPARAGQTGSRGSTARPCPDHPRACGANSVECPLRDIASGSSPRVRGKLHAVPLPFRLDRIIPARAGQTSGSRRPMRATPDHPRACGANTSATPQPKPVTGSSPRVRGKPGVLEAYALGHRIIPARAGQTVRFYAKTLERWTLNNWIRTVAPIFVLLFLLPVIGQNAYIERHYSNQSFSWFSKLHYASAFDLSLVA